MPFGEDLLDKQEEIEAFGAAGNASIARMCEFLRRRAQAAEDYARALGKIARQFSPAGVHELGLSDLLGSVDHTMRAYIAVAHDATPKLIDALRDTAKEHLAERAAVLSDVQKLRDDYAKMIRQMERLKDKRAAAILDAEDAKHAFLRVNYDRNASRAHVERLREDKERRAGKALYAKQEFIDGAKTFARIRAQFYGADLPVAFARLQAVEEARIARVKGVLCDFCSNYSDVLSEEHSYLCAFVSHWEQAAPAGVIEHFVEAVRSDSPFAYAEGDILALNDDEDNGRPEEEPTSPQRAGGIVVDVRASAVSGRAGRKASLQQLRELLATTEPLPLRAKLADLLRAEQLLVKEQDALLKLSGINAAAPDLSDHDTNAEVVRQMNEIRRELEDLRADRSKIQERLASLEHGAPVALSDGTTPPGSASLIATSPSHGEAHSEDYAVLSGLRSRTSVSVPGRPRGTGRRVNRATTGAFAMLAAVEGAAAVNPAPQTEDLLISVEEEQRRRASTRPTSTSPSSCGTTLDAMTLQSPPNTISGNKIAQDGNATATDECPAAQPQRSRGAFRAQVLYDFDARGRTAGELSVAAGEVVTIHTHDDEWWQAENANGSVGYVPHNYVCKLADSLGVC